jgi:DNA-nicking Smr family endonuclease
MAWSNRRLLLNMQDKPGSEEILRYLDEYGIFDKDRQGLAAPRTRRGRGVPKKHLSRRTLDLHGKTVVQAVSMLRQAISRCSENGEKELLVIHGQGHHSDHNEGPVLKLAVRDLLETELQSVIRDYGTAARRDGGDGATLVRLG